MNCLSAVTQLITRIGQRYKHHGYTQVRCAHHYVFREEGHWWCVLVCWYKETGTRPWLLLAFCASLGLIPSKREVDDLHVDNKRVDTGQDKFLPIPGMGDCCFRGCPTAPDMARALHRLWKAGRQRVPFLRYSLGMQKKRLSLWKQQQHCQEHVPVNFS